MKKFTILLFIAIAFEFLTNKAFAQVYTPLKTNSDSVVSSGFAFNSKSKYTKTAFAMKQAKDKKDEEIDEKDNRYSKTYFEKKQRYSIHTVFDASSDNDNARYSIHTMFDAPKKGTGIFSSNPMFCASQKNNP